MFVEKFSKSCYAKKLLSYLESENLLSSAQSGFRPGLSTLTQLTSAQSFINNNINELR